MNFLSKNWPIKGFFYALSACFLWGLIFVIPELLKSFSEFSIILGRYLIYGSTSLLFIIFSGKFYIFKNYSIRIWLQALLWCFISTFFYYSGIILGILYATAPVTIVISGTSPFVILLLCNRLKKNKIKRSSIFLFSFLIISGIIIVNSSLIDWSFKSRSFFEYCLGILGAVSSTLAWSIYVVKNHDFIEENQNISSVEWAYLIGICSFILSLIILGVLLLFSPSIIKELFNHPTQKLLKYFFGVSFLGIVSSIFGTRCWNEATRLLPAHFLSPLLIFETIFSFISFYLLTFTYPSLCEIIGMSLMIMGSFYSCISIKKTLLSRH